jgi:YtcA family
MTSRHIPRVVKGPVGSGWAALPLCLAACAEPQSPSLYFAGAYFPAWMLCAGIGVLVALLARAVMVASGLAERLPLQLWLCSAIGLLAALAAARYGFDR